jgi:molecular chaperone HtpG
VLRDNPARLVTAENAPGREFQRIQKLLGKDTELQPRILEINRKHSLIVGLAQRLATQAEDTVVAAVVEQLYDNALLLEGIHPNPSAMVPRIQQLLDAAVAKQNG